MSKLLESQVERILLLGTLVEFGSRGKVRKEPPPR